MAATLPHLLTTDEVADVLRTPAETVRYWRSVGKGPKSRKIGRRVLYDEADVAKWLAAEERRDAIAARTER